MKLPQGLYFSAAYVLAETHDGEIAIKDIVRYCAAVADNCKTGKDAADTILNLFGIHIRKTA